MKSSKAIVSHVCMIHPGLYSIAHPLVCYILLNVLLGNSSGWRADTVATYSKSRNLQLTKKKQNKIWRTSGYATLYHVFIISGPRSASVPHLAATELTPSPSGMCDEESEEGGGMCSPWEIFLEEGGKIQAAPLIPSVLLASFSGLFVFS